MVRNLLAGGLLAMTLAAPGLHAQTAPAGTTQPAASAVDPGAIQALKSMGAHLQTLKRFGESTEVTGERVLADVLVGELRGAFTAELVERRAHQVADVRLEVLHHRTTVLRVHQLHESSRPAQRRLQELVHFPRQPRGDARTAADSGSRVPLTRIPSIHEFWGQSATL